SWACRSVAPAPLPRTAQGGDRSSGGRYDTASWWNLRNGTEHDPESVQRFRNSVPSGSTRGIMLKQEAATLEQRSIEWNELLSCFKSAKPAKAFSRPGGPRPRQPRPGTGSANGGNPRGNLHRPSQRERPDRAAGAPALPLARTRARPVPAGPRLGAGGPG